MQCIGHNTRKTLVIQAFPSSLIQVYSFTVLCLFSFKFMKTIVKKNLENHREMGGHLKPQSQLP